MEIVDAHMHLWSPVTHPWVQKVRDGGHPAGKFGNTASKPHTPLYRFYATYRPRFHVPARPLPARRGRVQHLSFSSRGGGLARRPRG